MVGAGWADLKAEFEAGAEAGWQSWLWWRDDDAIEPTAPLKRLLELQRQSARPLALAVIPGLAPIQELASFSRSSTQLTGAAGAIEGDPKRPAVRTAGLFFLASR